MFGARGARFAVQAVRSEICRPEARAKRHEALRKISQSRKFAGVLGWAFRRLRGFLAGLPWVLCCSLRAPAAAADEEAVRVAYSAPASCPDEQVFIQRVRVRTEHGRFASPSEPARTFAVTLSELTPDAGFSGQLEFIDVEGPRAQRTVTGATCDEVASSLALIVALSIDDRVAQTNVVKGPPAAAAVPTPSGDSPRAASLSVSPNRTASPGQGRPASVRLRWDMGAEAGLLSWVAPKVAFAFGAFVELGSRPSAWSARLSAFDARQTEVNGLGQAKFATDWLRGEFCPLALRPGPHLSLSPCVAFDGGVLRATGSGPGLSSSFSTPLLWASADLLLRLGWEFRERLVLALDGELGAPLIRRDFLFENPHTRVFRVPALGVATMVAVGVRFP